MVGCKRRIVSAIECVPAAQGHTRSVVLVLVERLSNSAVHTDALEKSGRGEADSCNFKIESCKFPTEKL